jgi:hypothetical protein
MPLYLLILDSERKNVSKRGSTHSQILTQITKHISMYTNTQPPDIQLDIVLSETINYGSQMLNQKQKNTEKKLLNHLP